MPTQICQHFNQHGIDNFEIAILESRTTVDANELSIMESYWIHWLDTLNSGLNSKDEVRIHLDNHVIKASTHFHHQQDCFPYLASYIVETKQDKMT